MRNYFFYIYIGYRLDLKLKEIVLNIMKTNQEIKAIFNIDSYLDTAFTLLNSIEIMQSTTDISKPRFKRQLIIAISKIAVEMINKRNLKIKARKINEELKKLRDKIYNFLVESRYLEEFLPERDSFIKKIKVGPSYYELVI